MNVAHRITPTPNPAGSSAGHRLSFGIVPVDFSTARLTQLLPTERAALGQGLTQEPCHICPLFGELWEAEV